MLRGSGGAFGTAAITGGTLDGIQRVGFSQTAGGTSDAALVWESANVLSLKNGTNQQIFRVWGTTAGSKYLFLTHNASNAQIDVSAGALIMGGTATQVAFSSPISYAAPTTQTGTTYTAAGNDTYIIANGSATLTLTLPAASSFTGRRIVVKTIAAFTVVSATSNVVPVAGGAASTPILAATAGKWAELVSDGTNWITMSAN